MIRTEKYGTSLLSSRNLKSIELAMEGTLRSEFDYSNIIKCDGNFFLKLLKIK